MSGQQQQRPGNNTGKDSDMSTSRQEEMRQAPTKPPSLQIEAADAAKQALEAQQDAQEAVKRAYAKQLVAQEKAQQVTQQLAAQNETANEVAVMAAKQAAEQAAEQALKGQKEVLEQQFDQRMIAQEAARSTLAAARQQPFIDQGLKTGSPAVSSSAEQGFGKAPPSIHQQGATAQEIVLQAANSAAAEGQAQMAGAQQLAAVARNSVAQQEATQQAVIAQQKMEVAENMAQSAQSPESALQTTAYLSRPQPNQSMQLD